MTILDKEEPDLLSADDLFRSGQMPEMMQHWYAIRKQYPESFLIAYRMGDFYEFFYSDAINVSKILGLTLTKRGSGPSRHPLAGIPHKATQYFKTLVKLGQTVVIVEQLEDPKLAEGKIVKRGVIRILSPGTIIDDNLLESHTANFLGCFIREKRNFGLAFLDLSSGDFIALEKTGKEALRTVWACLARYQPVECVINPELLSDPHFMAQFREIGGSAVIVKDHPPHHFLVHTARETLKQQFHVESLAGFALEDQPLAICAAGALISFVKDTQKEEHLQNITKIRILHDEAIMYLDPSTLRNLELLRNQSDGSTYATLFSVLDQTQTPMGTRLLKEWIYQPITDREEIHSRLEIVQYFVDHFEIRQELRQYLSQIGDLSRLITRLNYSTTANARNLLQICTALEMISRIRAACAKIDHPILTALITQVQDFTLLVERISHAIHEQPPLTITEGGIIKDGYNSQVDEYRQILQHGKDWVLNFEEDEKKRLGISTGLKVAYNRVLGYFIQVTSNALKGMTLPADYIQRQTITTGVRYETSRLKEMETKIFSAEENLMDLEYQLFQEVREEIVQETRSIQEHASLLAKLDVLSTFAEDAHKFHYCRPTITNSPQLIIQQGRHPVVEQINTNERFVPNDCFMDLDQDQILIITGPNWSGKSTYLRQIALIVLMAQMGSFVPAQRAEIGLVDRIFTRIGATDDLARGQSTFLLEMTEMAQILNYTTQKSLILIDELGRGTGTMDGQAIAQAVIECLHELRVKTLFSTHFHSLITLDLPRIHNYHFKILEKSDSRNLVFLRQLTDGGTDKSYGIHVAMMAGLPEPVIDRAFALMENLNIEGSQPATKSSSKTSSPLKTIPHSPKFVQTILFPLEKVEKREKPELEIFLRSLDLDHMTPLQAFETLVKLKQKLASSPPSRDSP